MTQRSIGKAKKESEVDSKIFKTAVVNDTTQSSNLNSIRGPAVVFVKKVPQKMMMQRSIGKAKKESEVDPKMVKTIVDEDDPKKNTRKKNSRELAGIERQKHFENMKEILQWSNATPIRSRDIVGYSCCYCSEQFPNPADLKSHTLLSHEGISNASFTKKRDLNNLVIKVDITNLRCKICAKDMKDLNMLMEHLINEHSIKLHTDIKSHMLPFKFESDLLRCFICLNVYHRFKGLLEHMSGVHSRNYICDVCDAGFVNFRKLVVHEAGHKKGTFKCTFCDKFFTSVRKQKAHERGVHTHREGRKCRYCNEKFVVHSQMERHLVEVHGAQISTYNCLACDKQFTTGVAYKTHITRDHLLERKHACKECNMTFFSGSVLKEHMLKHSVVKNFGCNICLKTYSRRRTLKEHMRIHANDRRFKCDICEMAFVQRCSWRAHVRAKHGINV